MNNRVSSTSSFQSTDSPKEDDETKKKQSDSNYRVDSYAWWNWITAMLLSKQQQEKEQQQQHNENEDASDDRKVSSCTNLSLFQVIKKSGFRFSLCMLVWYVFRYWWRNRKQKKSILASANSNTKNRLIQNIRKSSIIEEIPFASVFALLQASGGDKIQDIWMSESDREVVVSLLENDNSSWKVIKNVIPEQMSQLASSFFQQQNKLPKTLPQSKYDSLKKNTLQLFIASSPFLYLFFMYRMLQNLYRQQSQQQNEDDIFEKNNNGDHHLTLKDVAGMEDVKSQLNFLFDRASTKNTNDYSHVLLYGPPGNGKTLLARALGQSLLQTNRIDALQCCNASDFVELYVGQGAKRIRNIFQSLKQRAIQKYNQNSVTNSTSGTLQHTVLSMWNHYSKIFSTYDYLSRNDDIDARAKDSFLRCRPPIALLIIDEMDSLAKSREGMKMASNHSGGGHEEREQTLMALFTELDVAILPMSHSLSPGKHTSQNNNAIVLVVSATNRPNVLDPALVRRFTKQIFIPNPNCETRQSIIEHYLDKKIKVEKCQEKYNISELVSLTEDFACSDIQQIIQHADWIRSMEHPSQSNNEHKHPSNGENNASIISQTHLKRAIETIRNQKSNIFNYQPYAWSSYQS